MNIKRITFVVEVEEDFMIVAEADFKAAKVAFVATFVDDTTLTSKY